MIVSKQTIARTPTRDIIGRQLAKQKLPPPPRFVHVSTNFHWLDLDKLRPEDKRLGVPDWQFVKLGKGSTFINREKRERRAARIVLSAVNRKWL